MSEPVIERVSEPHASECHVIEPHASEPHADPTTEQLEGSECWALIRTAEVARLAVCLNGEPEIFPINYVVDHGSIVFRSAPGTKLSAIADNAQVAFEVDGVDAGAGQAWSVVIKGQAAAVDEPHAMFEATDLPLFPWQASPKPVFVRIEPTEVSGRRFHVAEHDSGT